MSEYATIIRLAADRLRKYHAAAIGAPSGVFEGLKLRNDETGVTELTLSTLGIRLVADLLESHDCTHSDGEPCAALYVAWLLAGCPDGNGSWTKDEIEWIS